MDREDNFEGEIESMTIMFKAFASYDLWIQHDFLGVAGSNNNVNMLNQSSLFIGVLKGEAPNVNFMVMAMSTTRVQPDGIYPWLLVFVKTTPFQRFRSVLLHTTSVHGRT